MSKVYLVQRGVSPSTFIGRQLSGLFVDMYAQSGHGRRGVLLVLVLVLVRPRGRGRGQLGDGDEDQQRGQGEEGAERNHGGEDSVAAAALKIRRTTVWTTN